MSCTAYVFQLNPAKSHKMRLLLNKNHFLRTVSASLQPELTPSFKIFNIPDKTMR
ncbi:Uncharacterised protein [Budvicia aquatica]|uniref:Uncharacterized protein n=1 Tax=Budvicia aquatica TaxID=82979 RepID=A0A484ZXE5_9GAMM|nr:Uncharacterised protein [Budvicia aquatica]